MKPPPRHVTSVGPTTVHTARCNKDCACAARLRVRTGVKRSDPAYPCSATDAEQGGLRAQGRVPRLQVPDSGRPEVCILGRPRVQGTEGRAGIWGVVGA